MCLLLATKGIEIQRQHLESGFKSNQHGMGVAWAKDGKLFVEKGFFEFEKFYEAYQKTIGCPAILHFRWKTSGLQDESNCHPFFISENIAIGHNGMLSGFAYKIKDKSDTFAFIEQILKPLDIDTGGKPWYKNSGLKWLIESAISSNKFAIIDSGGHIEIFNEELGEYIDEEKNIWASNSMWKTEKVRAVLHNQYLGVANHPYSSGRHLAGYESDYSLTACDKTATKTSKIKDEEKTVDIWKVSKEELDEIDDYLDTLNS